MTRPLTKSPIALLALFLWILAGRASLADDEDPNALNQQVTQLIAQGKYQEAVPIAERAVEVAKRLHGLEHPDMATSLNNLAELYQVMGEYAKAEPLYQEALRIWQKILGPDHPDTATCLNNLAELYRAMGEYAKAESLLQEALRIRQKVLGPEHPDTATSLNNLAVLYDTVHEYAKAEPLLQEALRIRQKVPGPEDPNTAQSLNNLAVLCREMGEYAKAEPLLQEALRIRNPMHRSGLALAGAQTTIEAWKHEEVPPVENDGILTAEDVSTLDLQGTWLVTLSACDTGSGEAREGVMGLRRGFIQAGAQNLLMTLWPISDEVTVRIMSDFYEAAHNSGNAPEALAQVQRNWLVKLRTDKGLAQAVNLAGPFIISSQGKP